MSRANRKNLHLVFEAARIFLYGFVLVSCLLIIL